MLELKDTSFAENLSTQFTPGRKITISQKLQMLKVLQDHPECSTRFLIEKVTQIEGPVNLTVRHINRLRLQWQLNRKKGRPHKSNSVRGSNQCKDLVVVRPNISFVGLHLFDDWLEQQEAFSEIVVLLKEAIENHKGSNPSDSFPLLNHKEETLKCRFKALLYCPLFGIGKLTELDIKEHALQTVIGRGYQSSTLNQFLGQLERVNAAQTLMPALIPEKQGNICYIDGHMIAFWTKISMHKGKITMLGRIMPGSNAVVSHDEQGMALFVEYFPPDMRLPNVIIEYCEKVVSMTGINLFVIDREVNSLAIASAFDSKGWGLISMLDKNEYKDLSDWDAEYIGQLEDCSKVYSGPWKKRTGDLREFVIVETKDRLLPYWGTPMVKEVVDPIQWPKLYSQRNELQENSFKRMIDHGALNVNFGIKKIVSEDRHHQRKLKKLEDASAGIKEKIDKKKENIAKQEQKVSESMQSGHGKRLLQREKCCFKLQDELKELDKKLEVLEEKTESLGPPKERADRDFRKQKIMTFRTLLLENTLVCFLMALLEHLDIMISQKCLLEIFFKRNGGYLETYSEIVYWINIDGLSKANKQILEKLAEGIGKMELKRNEKPIRVELRALSP